jgi:hypothetical protein
MSDSTTHQKKSQVAENGAQASDSMLS